MAGERTEDLIFRITEELKDNGYRKVESVTTFLHKLADAQEDMCINWRALKKKWNVALKSGVLGYAFDDTIVNVYKMLYNNKEFVLYDITEEPIYTFSDNITIAGDTASQFSQLVINGASLNNTSNGVLWWKMKSVIIEIRKSDDNADSSLVLTANISSLIFPQTVILEEANSSGMSGRMLVSGKVDDTDQTNNKFTFEITYAKRTLKLRDGIEITAGDKIEMITFVRPTKRIAEGVDPETDAILDKYLVKLVLCDYRKEIPALPSRDIIKLEAMETIVQLNFEDKAGVKKSHRNTIYW